MKRSPLRRTGLRAKGTSPFKDLLYLCDELARAIQMTRHGAAWCPPESGPAYRSRLWIGECLKCGPPEVHMLEWSHFISRENHRLRHDPKNTHILCNPCHASFTHQKRRNPIRAWMVAQFGEAHVIALETMDRLSIKVDLRSLLVVLEAEVKSVGAGEQIEYARERLSRRRA